MNTHKYQTLFWVIFTFVLISVLSLTALLTPVTQGADLPNRDTPTPASPSDFGDDDDDDGGPVGATIELQVVNAPTGAWSVVQWKNSAGNWQDVAGWQGSLDENGYRRWWVAEKNFGQGPFRWVVTQGQGGPTLGNSEPFNLPDGANETRQVTIKI